MFLIDHEQARILEAQIGLQQFMGADDYIGLTAGDRGFGLGQFLFAPEAG